MSTSTSRIGPAPQRTSLGCRGQLKVHSADHAATRPGLVVLDEVGALWAKPTSPTLLAWKVWTKKASVIAVNGRLEQEGSGSCVSTGATVGESR